MVANRLLPQHQAMIEASAISPDVMEARGYKSMSSHHDQPDLEAMGFTKAQTHVPGLLIPLFGTNGELGGYQYRPDNPRKDKNGKPIKYETPKSQRNMLDIPPTVREAVRKGRQVILISEGARKADALATLGIPVINIAGVYGWRGKNEEDGNTALSDWEDISIKGNIFVLAFDSDILTKAEVHQALSRFKRFLEGRGAKQARILVLPHLLSGKTGVDDYIFETGATVEDLAKLVVDELPALDNLQPKAEPVDVPPLSELLNKVADFIRRYVVLNPNQLIAVALWMAHAHAFEAAETTLYMSVRSAEKRSGKSRLLEVTELIVPKPLKTENISVAALAHSVNEGVTLLLDEVDSLFGKGKASETQEMLRGILNSGFRTSGSYVRMVGQGTNMSPHNFNTFGPKMLSGIGGLSGTLDDRSIPIEMKRKTAQEYVERFRYRDAREQAKPIYDVLAVWAALAVAELRDARPAIPEELDDRAADGWEPLLAIAELAGDDWAKRAREAALALSTGRAREDDSLGVGLLTDIQKAFSKRDNLFTAPLLETLNALDESPWGAFRDGKGMTARTLANMLRKYGIRPFDIRVPGTRNNVQKGYRLEDCVDAFSRYLVFPSATSATGDNDATHRPNLSATDTSPVADSNNLSTAIQAM